MFGDVWVADTGRRHSGAFAVCHGPFRRSADNTQHPSHMTSPRHAVVSANRDQLPRRADEADPRGERDLSRVFVCVDFQCLDAGRAMGPADEVHR